MQEVNLTTILIALAPSTVAFLALLFTIFQWNKNLKEERKKRDEEIKRQEKTREDEIKQWEKEKRIDFLVNTIKDNEMPLAMRQAAAVEYIDTGYNGVTRAYVIQNHLYVRNPEPKLN